MVFNPKLAWSLVFAVTLHEYKLYIPLSVNRSHFRTKKLKQVEAISDECNPSDTHKHEFD